MKIKSIKIDGFKPFQFSQIDNLFLSFESPIHVILGTNGCGKSFLFNEMRFLPTPRANYESNGYKEIEVEHNGHTYTFGLDNSSSKKYYFFLEDGVELNQSGNESIQKDLIEKYFGYTKITEDILHYDRAFCESEPNGRKQFLKDINPCDLSILDQKRTLIRAKQTALKDRLKTVRTIISECESKLLPEEEFKAKEKEVEELHKEYIRLSSELAVVKNELTVLERENNNNDEAYTKLLGTKDRPLDVSNLTSFKKLFTDLKEC